MWSVRPRFSWMTSTEPFGRSAGAHAPCNSPFGPAKRTTDAGGGMAPGVDVDVDALEPNRPLEVACPSSSPPHAASNDAAPIAPMPRSPRRRNASRRVRCASA